MLLISLMAAALAQAGPDLLSPPIRHVAPVVSPAVDPWGVQFDMRSATTGRTYRIYMTRPIGKAPPGGWPVIYVLDGDIAFGTVAAQNSLRPAVGKSGAIVVGIGYPDAAAAMSLRNRDLTPSVPKDGRGSNGKGPPENYGGADAFHRFMMEELRPAVAAANPVNPADQTLMGYSLGGLFALHVMFQHPEAYRTYVVGSPSIWWNDREVLRDEPKFAAAVSAGAVAPRILITSDAWEQDPDRADLAANAADRPALAKLLSTNGMVDNARALAQRLTALQGKAGYRVNYAVFSDETHVTGIPAASSRGFTFALMP